MTKFLAYATLLTALSLPAMADTNTYVLQDATPAYVVVDRDVYIDTNIRGVEEYTDLIAALDHCEGEVHLYINSPGGDVFTMYALSDAIKNSNCTIDVTVRGIAASAAAVIAVSGDSLEMTEGALLMFHTIQMGGGGSLNLLDQRVTAFSSNFKTFLSRNAGHVLNNQEIQSIIQGQEIWLNKSQVDSRLLVPNTLHKILKLIGTEKVEK